MTTWEQTPGAVLRGGNALRPGALATVPGRDDRPRAEAYPDAAAAHRAAWQSSRWAFQATAPVTGEVTTQYADNTEVRATQLRLAEQGAPIGWCDFPDLGFPPPELRPLYALASARQARTGTEGPGGRDAELEAMIREADYARTPWAHRA